MRSVAAAFAAVALLAVSRTNAATLAPSKQPAAPMDSQVVLRRYARALATLATPKAVIFAYVVSQAGPTNIEQRHRIYRSGTDVRDETLYVNGAPVKSKQIHISKREDRYDIERTAPRAGAYALVFVRASKANGVYQYTYDAIPYTRAAAGFTVTRVTIDGARFLPSVIGFRTSNGTSTGHGELRYASFSGHWMPVTATVAATIGGKTARETIAFSDYRFPPSLPPSTFRAPHAVPPTPVP